MINWYKPSEKMPENGTSIVIITKGDVLWDIRERIYLSNKIHTDDYWAYASDFNFTKEENE